jgi:hypothetical protein
VSADLQAFGVGFNQGIWTTGCYVHAD